MESIQRIRNTKTALSQMTVIYSLHFSRRTTTHRPRSRARTKTKNRLPSRPLAANLYTRNARDTSLWKTRISAKRRRRGKTAPKQTKALGTRSWRFSMRDQIGISIARWTTQVTALLDYLGVLGFRLCACLANSFVTVKITACSGKTRTKAFAQHASARSLSSGVLPASASGGVRNAMAKRTARTALTNTAQLRPTARRLALTTAVLALALRRRSCVITS